MLLLYLLTSQKAVGSVLVREEDRVQHPTYYVGQALKDAETRCFPLEKVMFALITIVQKLVPYFQVHRIQVLTDQPLASVL